MAGPDGNNLVRFDLDVEFRRPDGTTMWVQDTARAINDENGKSLYFEGALIDGPTRSRRKKSQRRVSGDGLT